MNETILREDLLQIAQILLESVQQSIVELQEDFNELDAMSIKESLDSMYNVLCLSRRCLSIIKHNPAINRKEVNL